MPQSPIHDSHEAAGARFTDFGGWQMPVQYTGVLAEHNTVRTDVGLFDVSHLGRFEVAGPGAVDVVSGQLCNDIRRVEPGRAQYTMALNASGGVEDDIIVWYLSEDRLWVMPNGTNSDEIVDRFSEAAPPDVTITDIRMKTALFAVQGPQAIRTGESLFGSVPGRFRVTTRSFGGREITMAGTGYTGERGFEVAVDGGSATALWDAIVGAGAEPCGLGARDTLRLEMGYPLWGNDLDEETTPLEAGLEWVVAWDHDFVGKQALERQRSSGVTRRLAAFTTPGRAIPRAGYAVEADGSRGVVTSGNFSPTLGHGIGLAYMEPPVEPDTTVGVEIRGEGVVGTVVELPFIDRP
ncbi:MAG TPA: glycine cleavage system aminomethyltransferase GcvT [Acidimicrobiia bacterium]|nr:glycine cleavage system aminomethyltransferase GcvT [Acidimicrobiia bacterium]